MHRSIQRPLPFHLFPSPNSESLNDVVSMECLATDLADSVATAVINKRAGGMGLILGRKAFQRPFNEGVEILEATQDVYLDNSITIA